MYNSFVNWNKSPNHSQHFYTLTLVLLIIKFESLIGLYMKLQNIIQPPCLLLWWQYTKNILISKIKQLEENSWSVGNSENCKDVIYLRFKFCICTHTQTHTSIYTWKSTHHSVKDYHSVNTINKHKTQPIDWFKDLRS